MGERQLNVAGTWTLVLGAGGPLGAAFEAGLVAGLAEHETLRPERIIGTSAGAIIGSQLALGRSPHAVFEGQLQRARTMAQMAPKAAGNTARAPQAARAGLPAFMSELVRAAISGEETPQRLLAQIGQQALAAAALPEAMYKANFSRMFSETDAWPASFVCVAVNAGDGSLAAWDSPSGVDLVSAIAASSCSPLVASPITIHGQRFMDGGLRSTTNADLAKGSRRVLIVAPLAAGDMAAPVSAQISRETTIIETAGGTTFVIVPDAASVEAFGPDSLDASRGEAVARAGLAQGKAAATAIERFTAS
jgi:NTE family protein